MTYNVINGTLNPTQSINAARPLELQVAPDTSNHSDETLSTVDKFCGPIYSTFS